MNRTLLMLKRLLRRTRLQLSTLITSLRFGAGRVCLPVVSLCVAFLTVLPPAAGQTLTMAPFPPPDAINQGDQISTGVSVSGFNSPVNLTCVVTPVTTPAPACTVSPNPVTSPGDSASVTVMGNSAPPGLYAITVTAMAGMTPPQMAEQNLTIQPVVPSFTITVTTPVTPTSVHAGNGGSGVITVTPSNGYISPGTAGVTLSCSSMTPLVTIPPVCSFNPPAVPVSGGVPSTSTITINTSGPITTGAVARKGRSSYALWLPLPMLALVGLGAAAGGKRSRKAWGLLALFVVSASFLLIPACGTPPGATTTPNGITPNNAYTFTVSGVDIDGVTSSNAGSISSSSGAPTVTLTVD